MSRRFEKLLGARPDDPPPTTVVTIPRRRGSVRGQQALEQRRRRQQAKQAGASAEQDGARAHGWGRADDPDAGQLPRVSFLDRRRADGTPLLLFVVLAVLTGVGLARVDSRIEILDLANEITGLSEDQQRLLDRKRRLEAERAYLRRPVRVSAQAADHLNMIPTPAERIQRIELVPAPEPEPEPGPEPEPTPEPEASAPAPSQP